MSKIGMGLTKGLTLPIVAIGAASVKFALDFSHSMTNVEALVGMSSKQVAGFKDEILKLAPAVGKSPQELGEAFYFIASSGLKGEAAMRALNASARASAAGLGETKVVADAVTSAINAYGEKSLSASRATDILVAAVREGKSEPEAFAGSIGRVIPIAAKMGVSFGEVAGQMAAMSLNGTDATEAVTQISAMLASAIKPTKDGAEALKSIGMSYGDLRKEIADKGLTNTVGMLDKAFNGNIETLGKLFPNLRALRGFLALTGAEAEKYAGVIGRVTQAQGDSNKAFEIAMSKPGAKLAQAWAGIQAAMIQVGDIMLPVLGKIATQVAGLAKSFSGLSDGTKEWVVKLALGAAVFGPLILGAGRAVAAVLALRTAFLGAAAAQATLSAGGAGTGLAGLAAGAGFAGLLATGVTAGAAVAIGAAVFLAVSEGLKQGIDKAKADTSTWGKWDNFWTGFGKGMKDAATDASNWLDKLLGGASGQARIDAYGAAMGRLATMAAQATTGMGQLRAEILKIDFPKAMALPPIKAAIELDTVKSKADLLGFVDIIQKSLNVPLKEAKALTKLIFPADWGAAFGTKVKTVGKTVEDLRNKYDALQKELQKQIAFGTPQGVSKVKSAIDQVVSAWNAGKNKAEKAAKDMGEAGSIVARGIDASGYKVKVSAGNLVSFVQIPLGKAGPKFLAAGGDASGKYATGLGKTGKVTAAAAAIAAAAGKPMAAAAMAAAGYGSNMGSSFSSSLAAQAGAARAAGYAVGSAGAAGLKAGTDAGSPSKKGIYYGLMLGEGFRIGIQKGTQKAMEAASSLATSVLSVLDSALASGASINDLGSANLPTMKYAKQWATKAASMMKAIIKAMQAAFAGIDIGKATKGEGGKSSGWKAEAFGSVVSMAEAVGSIFTTFAELTTEKIDAAVIAINAVQVRAKEIGKAIAKMVNAILFALRKTVISEFVASSATRSLDLANAIAGVITTFSVITGEQIVAAVAGLDYLAGGGKEGSPIGLLSLAIKRLADAISAQFTADTTTVPVSEAAAAAVQIANDIAGIITTFSTITKKTVDAAIIGIGEVVKSAPLLGEKLKEMVGALKLPLLAVASDPDFTPTGEVATKVATFVSDIANTIGSLAGMAPTGGETTPGVGDEPGTTTPVVNIVDNALLGIAEIIKSGTALGDELKKMVTALKDPLLAVAEDPSFTPLGEVTTKLNTFITDLASFFNNLAQMVTPATESTPMVSLVQSAIDGAADVSLRAATLGEALTKMVDDLNLAVGSLEITKLTNLSVVLIEIDKIALAIKNIVVSLAEITATKVASATASGASLGQGFLAGLHSKHQAIVDEATQIAKDAAGALAGKNVTVSNITAPIIKGVPGIVAMASGGFVPARAGGTLTRLGEGGQGEWVIPQSKVRALAGVAPYAGQGNTTVGSTSVTVNFTGPIYASTPQQAQQVGSALGGSAANAAIIKLAAARRATTRGAAR